MTKLQEGPDKMTSLTEYLTADLTQKGWTEPVTTPGELAEFRKNIQKLAGIDDQSKRPLDEKELIDIVQDRFTALDKDKNNELSSEEIIEGYLKYRWHTQSPRERLDEAALRYMARRTLSEGEVQDVTRQEKISDAKTISGSVTMIPGMFGFMYFRHAGQNIPAQFRTVKEKQSYVTPSILEQWQKEAK
ncbi:MAG: hypothetical protein K2W95_08555 [Candidatus Obscuribacterales bacterium]|nr:hypothetical protein [Candidatus Obscuribacterales bacterium]